MTPASRASPVHDLTGRGDRERPPKAAEVRASGHRVRHREGGSTEQVERQDRATGRSRRPDETRPNVAPAAAAPTAWTTEKVRAVRNNVAIAARSDRHVSRETASAGSWAVLRARRSTSAASGRPGVAPPAAQTPLPGPARERPAAGASAPGYGTVAPIPRTTRPARTRAVVGHRRVTHTEDAEPGEDHPSMADHVAERACRRRQRDHCACHVDRGDVEERQEVPGT